MQSPREECHAMTRIEIRALQLYNHGIAMTLRATEVTRTQKELRR